MVELNAVIPLTIVAVGEPPTFVPPTFDVAKVFVEARTTVKDCALIGLGGKVIVQPVLLAVDFSNKMDVVAKAVAVPLLPFTVTSCILSAVILFFTNLLIIVVVVASMVIASIPFASKEILLVVAERPVLVLPVNCNEGIAALPEGNIKVPVIVSPDFNTFNEALPVTFPVKLAVMIFAAKLPEASRFTIVLAVLSAVASFTNRVADATFAAF